MPQELAHGAIGPFLDFRRLNSVALPLFHLLPVRLHGLESWPQSLRNLLKIKSLPMTFLDFNLGLADYKPV